MAISVGLSSLTLDLSTRGETIRSSSVI